jgi:hypothetical protein
MTKLALNLASTLLFLLVAAAPASAAGPRNCHFRLVGWTPDGTGYVHHMECVGENLATGQLSKVGDENASPVDLCNTASCPTLRQAATHPRIRALKLRPSGKAPAGLSAKATVSKGRAWTLTFTMTQGRRTIRLGTRSVGGTRWRLKETLWEPEGRAVAFSFDIEEGPDDKGEFLHVFPVPASARPAATGAKDLRLPFGLTFGMAMPGVLQHLEKQGIRPQRFSNSLNLQSVKFLGHLASGQMLFSAGKGLSEVRFVISSNSRSEARKARTDLKTALTTDLGRQTSAKGSRLTWTGREVQMVYYESDEATGAPGEVMRVTAVEFTPVK